MAEQTEKPCFWCGRSEDAHETDPRPYRALMGFHDYQPTVYEPPIARPDRPAPDGCRCATSERPGECTCPPANPLAGVHVGSPSGRLPWTDRLPETPSYQTGRVPTERTHDGKSHPLPPVPEQSYPTGAVELPVHTDRPGIIRRILNARKASS